MKRTKISYDQIRLVLNAIAYVEGWDGAHASVATERDGTWTLVEGQPLPSFQLIRAIRQGNGSITGI